MTREESIKLVKEVAGMSLDWDDAHYDALQMAIKALEKEPRKGHWIDHSDEGYVKCPICGREFVFLMGGTNLKFCPNCGSQMSYEQEREVNYYNP